jgi:hypothetical protein
VRDTTEKGSERAQQWFDYAHHKAAPLRKLELASDLSSRLGQIFRARSTHNLKGTHPCPPRRTRIGVAENSDAKATACTGCPKQFAYGRTAEVRGARTYPHSDSRSLLSTDERRMKSRHGGKIEFRSVGWPRPPFTAAGEIFHGTSNSCIEPCFCQKHWAGTVDESGAGGG